MNERQQRENEDFKFRVLCHAKGDPAMYELLRDRSLDEKEEPVKPKTAEQIIRAAVTVTGWDDNTILGLLVDYVQAHADLKDFAAAVSDMVADEITEAAWALSQPPAMPSGSQD